MDRTNKLILAILPIVCTLHFAEASEFNIPHLYATEHYQWHAVHSHMSHQEYQTTTRHNQRMARKNVTKYLEGKLMSIGVPERGIEFTSAAVGLAVQGAKIHLNENQTIALELNNVLDNDPEVFFKLNFDW